MKWRKGSFNHGSVHFNAFFIPQRHSKEPGALVLKIIIPNGDCHRRLGTTYSFLLSFLFSLFYVPFIQPLKKGRPMSRHKPQVQSAIRLTLNSTLHPLTPFFLFYGKSVTMVDTRVAVAACEVSAHATIMHTAL